MNNKISFIANKKPTITEYEAELVKYGEYGKRLLLVPDIGTEMTLCESSIVRLYKEYRNSKVFEKLFDKDIGYGDWGESFELLTLPKGTTLVVDRIYIRKGKQRAEYASITFRLKTFGEKKMTGRFWLKLSDVNKLRVNINKDTLARN